MNIDTTETTQTTETAIGFIPCYTQPFDCVFHSDFLKNEIDLVSKYYLTLLSFVIVLPFSIYKPKGE